MHDNVSATSSWGQDGGPRGEEESHSHPDGSPATCSAVACVFCLIRRALPLTL